MWYDADMNTNEAMRHMIEASGQSLSKVSTDMGKSRTFLASTFTKGSTSRVDTLAAVARLCGYRLVIVGHGEEIDLTDCE